MPRRRRPAGRGPPRCCASCPSAGLAPARDPLAGRAADRPRVQRPGAGRRAGRLPRPGRGLLPGAARARGRGDVRRRARRAGRAAARRRAAARALHRLPRRARRCRSSALPEAVREVSTLLRERARAAFPLPEQEVVDYEVVTDKPWAGFNYYLGGFRSTVAINADLPVGLGALPALVAHESYPGHHTERCRKQVAQADLPEYDLWLVNTPGEPAGRGAGRPRAGRPRPAPTGGRSSPSSTPTSASRYDGERGAADRRAPPRRSAPCGRTPRSCCTTAARRPTRRATTCARWALQSPQRADKTRRVPHRPAVAGVHDDLRRGRAAAVAVARRAPGRAARGRALRPAARRAADPGGAAPS